MLLVSGPTALPAPRNVKFQSVETTREMMDAVLAAYPKVDVVIMAAAVADYRPHHAEEQKIKKNDDTLTLSLDKNPDILKQLGQQKEHQFLVGFAAETQHLLENAAAKVKNLITEMSHDLRTPLTTLLLYTEILRHRKYETTAQAEDYLAKIDTKARQLKQLSDNLFEYALVTRDTVAVLDPPARFSQIFEEPLTEMVGELQERGFACALELGEEDDTLTVKEQYVRRILDNITSNLLKYADPAQDISVRFVKENGKAGLAFENAVLPGQHRTDSTKVGLTSIETMMEKMHAVCRIKQSGERFCITLLFPIEK